MKIYIFLLVVVLSFLGCEKEMMDYEGKMGFIFRYRKPHPVYMVTRKFGLIWTRH